MTKEANVVDFREKNFVMVTKCVLADMTILDKPTHKLVYASLCMHADNTTKTSYPSIKRLARECCCSENTVRAALKRLKEVGLIDIQERFSKEIGQLPNLYKILNPPKEYEEAVKLAEGTQNQHDPIQYE